MGNSPEENYTINHVCLKPTAVKLFTKTFGLQTERDDEFRNVFPAAVLSHQIHSINEIRVTSHSIFAFLYHHNSSHFIRREAFTTFRITPERVKSGSYFIVMQFRRICLKKKFECFVTNEGVGIQ